MEPSLEVQWVNHASFVVRERQSGVSLICDPWLEGTAFKDGWELVSPTEFRYEDFREIDYVWFSHQHPDHFAPTNLKKIEPEIRRTLTVLYQQTADGLVLNWCKSARFGRVRELPLNEWFVLNDRVSLMCGTVDDDSWLAIRTPERVLLNVNDCVLKRQERIQTIADAVGHVDVLFTQFSYAQWTGNPPDAERRRRDAKEKYDRIALQSKIINPDIIVPFASYVYFCHEENFFQNDGMNRVADIADFVERDLGKKAVVLYPGDKWNTVDLPDWRMNAHRYATDLEMKLAAGPTRFRKSSSATEVEKAVSRFIQRLRDKNPHARRVVRERATVFLTDIGLAYEISIDGIVPVNVSERQADIATSSENLLYAIKTPWGGNTMHVSGRFVSWQEQHERYFALMRKLHHYNVTPMNAAWLMSGVRRVLRAIGRRVHRLRPNRPRVAGA